MTEHFAKVCRTPGRKQEQNNSSQRDRSEGRVNCSGEDDCAEEYAFTVGTTRSCEVHGSVTVDVHEVGGVVIKGVAIDSGPSFNTVDRLTWKELKPKEVKCKSEKSTKKQYPYGTSGPLETLGKFQATTSVAGKEMTE